MIQSGILDQLAWVFTHETDPELLVCFFPISSFHIFLYYLFVEPDDFDSIVTQAHRCVIDNRPK